MCERAEVTKSLQFPSFIRGLRSQVLSYHIETCLQRLKLGNRLNHKWTLLQGPDIIKVETDLQTQISMSF